MRYYKILEHWATDEKGNELPVGTMLKIEGELPSRLVNKGIFVSEAPKKLMLVVNPKGEIKNPRRGPPKPKKVYSGVGNKRILPINME